MMAENAEIRDEIARSEVSRAEGRAIASPAWTALFSFGARFHDRRKKKTTLSRSSHTDQNGVKLKGKKKLLCARAARERRANTRRAYRNVCMCVYALKYTTAHARVVTRARATFPAPTDSPRFHRT